MGPSSVICHHISSEQLSGMHNQGDIEQVLVIQRAGDSSAHTPDNLPPEVQSILQEYTDVFC